MAHNVMSYKKEQITEQFNNKMLFNQVFEYTNF